MLHAGSLPCSQNPATGPYCEPGESGARLHTLFQDPSILILYIYVSQVASTLLIM
jgi:hypothetical protein